MKFSFKDLAKKQCEKSSYKKRLGAVVVNRGKVVGLGHNVVQSTGIKTDGLHAEISALRNTSAKFRYGSTVYVCRILKNQEIALSKPCHACSVVMKKMGVKYVWYSVGPNWVRMKL